MPHVLDRELATFEREKERLLATVEGQFVLIHGDRLLGIFPSEADAIGEGYDQLGNVPFFVKQVLRIERPFSHPSILIGS